MKKVVLDAGHGYNTAGKRTPDGVREWSLNSAVCGYIQSELNNYEDVQVYRTDDTSGNSDVSLTSRTNKIKQIMPNIMVSVHHNALGSSWNSATGVEVYAHPSSPSIDKSLAKQVVDKLASYTGLKNRGAKTADFHMLREVPASVPAILVEGGFMDCRGDYAVITSANGQKQYAKAVVEVIVSHLGLKRKAVSQSSTSGSSKFAIGSYQKKVKIIDADTLNVRSGRGTEHSVIGTLKRGDIITINYILPDNRDGKGDSALWGSFDFKGKTGYVHLGYCQAL